MLSTAAVMLLLPVMLPVMILLRFTGEGEIFFLQQRIGQNLVPFPIYKFATMQKNSPQMLTGTITVNEDPRILPVGKYLRKTKINELPQLLNIIFGQMSLIGPRPQTKECWELFSAKERETISLMKPGLSGIGSIIFRDEEGMLDRNDDSKEFYENAIVRYKAELEIWFFHNNSAANYFKLIILTVWVVIFPHSNAAWKLFPSLPERPIWFRN
jgi:lipopolysaccharide/colanic/teichoic acid biosynthesis glycosyltransferase